MKKLAEVDQGDIIEINKEEFKVLYKQGETEVVDEDSQKSYISIYMHRAFCDTINPTHSLEYYSDKEIYLSDFDKKQRKELTINHIIVKGKE